MTIKQYNAMRRRIYDAAMEDAEIRAAMEGDITGMVYVFELSQLPDKHAVMICTRKTQYNAETIRSAGLDPDRTEARRELTLNQKTKCANF